MEALPLFEREARERQAHGMTAPGVTLSQQMDQASDKGEAFVASKSAAGQTFV